MNRRNDNPADDQRSNSNHSQSSNPTDLPAFAVDLSESYGSSNSSPNTSDHGQTGSPDHLPS